MPLTTLARTSDPPAAILRRYYPVLLTGAALTVAYLTYRVYNNSQISAEQGGSTQLRRSNARRSRAMSRPARSAAAAVAETNSIPLPTNEQIQQMISASEAEGNSLVEVEQQIDQTITDALSNDTSLTAEEKQNQNLLNLLYHIAEDNAKREGYIHRGVTCNGCGTQPIRGIRYRCSNCMDFDLCEHCEAAESHPKTHLFFKVRIPAPFLGSPRQVFQPWYPGKPGMMAPTLENELSKQLQEEAGFDQSEVDALYEQFKCMAATEFPNDPLRLNGAINRPTFDKCFFPSCGQRPPPPNLIYDRMFEFYDTNNDGLIDFKEFLLGLAALSSKSRAERLRRIFKGYDFDNDGYITRGDFLKMFKAYYALQKELIKDTVAVMEDDVMEPTQMVSHLLGSQPVSAVFQASIPVGGTRVLKPTGVDPDEELTDIILPSGNDTMRPGDSIRNSHTSESRQRAMRRDIGIIGISGAEPPTVFSSREMEEGRRVFQNWVEERLSEAEREGLSSANGETETTRSLEVQPSASVRQAQTDEPPVSERDFNDEGASRTSQEAGAAVGGEVPPSSPGQSGVPTRTPTSHSNPSPTTHSSPSRQPSHPTQQQQQPYTFSTPTSISSSHPHPHQPNPHLPTNMPYLSDREDTNTHAEILYEITKQGLNELLDLIFKEREKEAAEYRKKKEREERRRRKKEALRAQQREERERVEREKRREEEERADDAATAAFGGVAEGEEKREEIPAAETGTSRTTTPPLPSSTTPPSSSTPPLPSSTRPSTSRPPRTTSSSSKDKENKENVIASSMIDERPDPKKEGIDYEEFERLMMGENGRKLAFVGAWVEMVSF